MQESNYDRRLKNELTKLGSKKALKESSLERRLKNEVEKFGGKALKFTSPGMAGVPDRIVLLPNGRTVFVEMKASGKKLKPIQAKRKQDFERLGHQVYVLDSVESIKMFIREVEE